MDKQYNLSNLEANFKQYLLAVNGKTRINTNNKDTHERTLIKGLNPVSIKNYLSDLRHFLGWLNSDSRRLKSVEILPLIQSITSAVIDNYKSYLTNDHTPVKTINRRLSTLRKFGGFCISQGWMKENPAKRIKNYELRIKNGNEEILTKYEKYLVKKNLDRQNINNLIADTKEFYQLTQNL